MENSDWDERFELWKARQKAEKERREVIKKTEERKVDSVVEEFKEKTDHNFGDKRIQIIERIVISVIFIAFFVFLVYLIMASLFPKALPFNTTGYAIQADDNPILDNFNSLSIDNPSVLGEAVVINNQTVKPIISQKKFNVVFNPKVNIPKGTNATLSITFLINESNSSDIYVNNKLVFPDLSNYQLIEENDKDYIYIRKDLMQYIDKSNLKEGKTSEEFLYNNFPGTHVWSTRQLTNPNVTISDYARITTTLEGPFRDNLNLAVYVEDDLQIDLRKQDLNGYLGGDEYNMTLKDANGKTVYSVILEDDGIKRRDKVGEEKKFEYYFADLEKGIYYLSFIKDENNDASDSTLKDIKVNTNKVVIVGTFLPWNSINLYTENVFPRVTGFNYWWKDKNQEITIDNKILNLSLEWQSKTYLYNLTPGNHLISISKGFLWVYVNQISPKEDNWFNIPEINTKIYDHPEVIIINRDNFKNNLLEIKKENITRSSDDVVVGVQVLEENVIYLREINLTTS